MSPEKVTLQRVQSALYHVRRGLAPFVEERMMARYGAQWPSYAIRALSVDPRATLDEYGLLKTMINRWRDAFEDAFPRADKHRVRSFVSIALEARNTCAHAVLEIEDAAALRYLDACHELLRATSAPEAEIVEITRLYEAQRYAGLPAAEARPRVVAAPTSAARPLSGQDGTIAERLLDYVRLHPGLDDDELSRHLDIHPRQTINQEARRLANQGLLRRAVGPRGKIVNRAEEERR